MLGILFIPGLISGLFSNVLVFFSLFTLLLCLAYKWWKIRRAYGPFPSCRLDTKLLPHLILKRPKNVTQIVFQELIEQAKTFQTEGLCVFWFFRPFVLIHSEEFLKILINDTALANKGSVYELNALLIGNGLLSSKHEVWMAHRKLLDPAFKLGVLKCKMRSLNENASRLTEQLQTVLDKPFDDVLDVLKHCIIRIMEETVMGLNLNDEIQESHAEIVVKLVTTGTKQFIDRIFRPWIHWDFLLPLFPVGRKYLKTANESTHNLHMIVEEFLKPAVVSDNEDQHNVEEEIIKSAGHILVKHHLQDPSFTEKDVRDHLVDFVVGGYETVSITMMWCFYLLGHHPHAQEKAYNEVKSVVPEGDVTYDDLTKLQYLNCVMKETLRLYSTVPMFSRSASRDIQCGKYTIPKGAEVLFFVFMLHRNPTIYPHPEKFDPERFSDISKIRNFMHVPFAEGYRNCIGKKLAMMEMKVLLVHVLRRFKITTLNKIDDSELDWTMILQTTKRPRLLFKTRQSQN